MANSEPKLEKAFHNQERKCVLSQARDTWGVICYPYWPWWIQVHLHNKFPFTLLVTHLFPWWPLTSNSTFGSCGPKMWWVAILGLAVGTHLIKGWWLRLSGIDYHKQDKSMQVDFHVSLILRWNLQKPGTQEKEKNPYMVSPAGVIALSPMKPKICTQPWLPSIVTRSLKAITLLPLAADDNPISLILFVFLLTMNYAIITVFKHLREQVLIDLDFVFGSSENLIRVLMKAPSLSCSWAPRMFLFLYSCTLLKVNVAIGYYL